MGKKQWIEGTHVCRHSSLQKAIWCLLSAQHASSLTLNLSPFICLYTLYLTLFVAPSPHFRGQQCRDLVTRGTVTAMKLCTHACAHSLLHCFLLRHSLFIRALRSCELPHMLAVTIEQLSSFTPVYVPSFTLSHLGSCEWFQLSDLKKL